jgi:hypothetical protein
MLAMSQQSTATEQEAFEVVIAEDPIIPRGIATRKTCTAQTGARMPPHRKSVTANSAVSKTRR